MSKILRISTEFKLKSDRDSKDEKTSPSRSRGSAFTPAKSLHQSPCKVSTSMLTTEAERDIDSRCQAHCAETLSAKSIIESIVTNYEALQYAANSGGSVGVFATVFTSPSFRDRSFKSTASPTSSFFCSSGDPLDHSSSTTVDRTEKRNSQIPSSSHSSPILNKYDNTHSAPPVPSSSPGASRLPPSLSLDTRHLARSSNARGEQPGSTETSETLRQSKSLDANPLNLESLRNCGEDDDDESPPTAATPIRSVQRKQDQQLPVSVTPNSSVARPSVAPVYDGPPRDRIETLEVDDSSTSGRQSDSRLGAPGRRFKGKIANRRSQPYSATAGRPMPPRSSRRMRQRVQRTNSFFVHLFDRVRRWFTAATPHSYPPAASTSSRHLSQSTSRTQPGTPTSPYQCSWKNVILYTDYPKPGE